MSTTSNGFVSVLGLDPAVYRPHPLHAPERSYPETNCYTDILIEFLHARGHEPLAMMGCVLRVDFEGDQWTFFKPLPEQIERLYGVDIHEMQPYRPLPEQIAEQLARDRTIIVELDSWYLPDTAATSYRREHVKSSVVAEAIDRDGERLRYFHGPGYYELEGEDYRGVFRLGRQFSDDVLPPYTEIVRLHAAYHDYAFATVRMVGSAFEVGASHVEWLLGDAGGPAASAMAGIVEGCKILSFKLARRRAFDPQPAIVELALAWEQTFAALESALA